MDKSRLIAFFVILAIIVGILVISYDRRQNTTPATTTGLTSASDTLVGLAKELAVTPQLRDSMYVDWIDEKNNIVPLTGKQFIIGTVDVKGIKKYKDIKDIENTTFATLRPLEQATNAFFTANGFSANTQNSKQYGIEPAPYKTLGFENGNLKCLVRFDERTDPFGSFFCGSIDTAQINLQKQMGNMLPYQATKEGITSLRVQKIENNFATGTYSEAFTGYTWMAKKEAGKWNILWKSNDIAPCADMERLGIPQSIYGNCYTPED
jgi:hypothetical protein